MLTQEQIAELKKQLSEQIKHLPEAQRVQAQKQIDEMSSETLEYMLKQQVGKGKSQQDEIFRLVVSGEIPSKKIDENKEAIAVLEIKPLVKGHTLIIPKKKVVKSEEMPVQAFSLAKKIAKKITSKLKASRVEIQTEFKLGEQLINIVPNYGKPINYAQRYDASEKELEELYLLLRTIKKANVLKIQKKPKTSLPIMLKRRIP